TAGEADMAGQTIGYIRVSTVDQSTERQLDGVQVDEVFEDKASGKSAARPGLEALLKHARKGDAVVVHSLDRLARNAEDLLRTVCLLTERGASVRFLKEHMEFTPSKSDPRSELMLMMLAAFAQFERSLIRERQAEGIALAKKAGKYKGRKPSLSEEQRAELRERVKIGEPKAAVARAFGISRETLYQYLKAA